MQSAVHADQVGRASRHQVNDSESESNRQDRNENQISPKEVCHSSRSTPATATSNCQELTAAPSPTFLQKSQL